jgi:hypothetical protein
LLAPHVQQPKIEVSLRPVGIDALGGDELCHGADKGGLLLRRQRQHVGSGHRARRFDADTSNRIAEQSSRCLNHGARRQSSRRDSERRRSDERIRIADRRLYRALRGRGDIRRQ